MVSITKIAAMTSQVERLSSSLADIDRQGNPERKRFASLRAAGPRVAHRILSTCIVALVLGCQPTDPSVGEAERLFREGHREEGIETLRSLLAESPDDPMLLFAYGRMLTLDGQVTSGRWPLTRAMTEPEWTARAGMVAAQGAYAVRGYEDAIAITTEILKSHPEHVPALLLRAEAGLDARLDDEAPLADAKTVLELEPDNEQALRLEIVALLNLERLNEAKEGLDRLSEKLRTRGEQDPDALADLCAIQGTFLLESGALDDARVHWNGCLEQFPAHLRVLEPAIDFFDRVGEMERSVEILEGAIEAEPGNGLVAEALAARLTDLGRRGEAERILRETADRHPRVGWSLLADHYRRVEDHRSRAEALDRLADLERAAPSSGLLFERADAWLLAGDLERAEELAKSIDVEAERTLVLGRVALERGAPQEALRLFEETTRVWPNQTFARYYAGYAAELIGDFDRAIEEYRHAIRSGAEKTDARFRLAQILAAEGKHMTAIETLSIPGGPPSLNTRKLLLRLLGRTRHIEVIREQMSTFWGVPGVRAELFEQAVIGFAEAAGPKAAAEAVEGIPIDLSDPRDARLLRRYVQLSLKVGRAEAAAERAQRALAASPASADLNEIAGLVLENAGRDPERSRSYYERALEIDPGHVQSLLGLARLDLGQGRRVVARATLDRALANARPDRSLLLTCAEMYKELDDEKEAERILAELVREEPSDARATERLARLRFRRSLTDDWTMMLARSAARLGGGRSAQRLLAEILEDRGEKGEGKLEGGRAAGDDHAVVMEAAGAVLGDWTKDDD